MHASRRQPPAGLRLRDAHLHLYQYARSMEMVDLSGCGSGAEMLELIDTARRQRKSALLLADKARPEAWDPPGWPRLDELDAATGGAMFCGWCFDYHALIANTPALERAGVRPDTPDFGGGIYGRDRDGRLTGVVYERAALRVWEAMPDTDRDRAGELLAAAVRALRRHGFAEAHDLKSQTWLGGELAALSDQRELDGFEIVLWPLLEDVEEVIAGRRNWERPGLRLGGAKIFVDGTLNSRTAWMLHPFADGRPDHPRGVAMMSPREIESAVRRCDELGVPLAAHAIGDGAVRAVLDAIECVRPVTPGFRIEHAELVDEADVRRFAELGVICSVQPCHLLYDIEALRRAVPDRLDRVLPLRALVDAGCTPGELLIFGSDAPIVRPDPGDSLQAAIERRRVGGEDVIAPGQAVSSEEAIACFRAPGRVS